jgi:hypothetical protein
MDSELTAPGYLLMRAILLVERQMIIYVLTRRGDGGALEFRPVAVCLNADV